MRLPSKSPAEGSALLIAAQSGRALAAAARRAGLVPLVADLFGDADTLELAAAHRFVRGRLGRGLIATSVTEGLEALAAAAPCPILGLVLGSGFEVRPRLIAELDRRFGVLGASAEAVRRLKDPLELAALLSRIGAPHPEVRVDPAADPAAWLVKRRGGSGGSHVGPASTGALPSGTYLQALVPGRPISIAFLADGSRALIVGVSEQWSAPSRASRWRFGGAVEPADLAEPVCLQATAAIEAIVREVGLVGLASADLMVEAGRWWLLEINPRPGATLDILDRGPVPLLQRHIEAARGRLGAALPAPPGAAGTQIVYAGEPIAAVPPIAWPAFVLDRPRPGTRIRAGAPICTLAARAQRPALVRARLAAREAAILAMLNQGSARDRISQTA